MGGCALVRVVDGGYGLLMGGAGLVVGWCGSGCWSLGLSFGVIHRWLALGMVVVGVVHCDCRVRCHSYPCRLITSKKRWNAECIYVSRNVRQASR
jgi:hypothetical protein